MSLIGQQLEHYQVLRLIGQGSMGEVYLAEDTQSLRQVAIKVVHNGFQTAPDDASIAEAFELFQREMKMISQFDHTHILPYTGFGHLQTDEGLVVYALMHYYSDGSLADWLDKRGQDLLTIQDVGNVIAPVASALQLAHDYGVTHGAVKPSNLLVELSNDHPGYPDLLLSDFNPMRALSPILSDANAVRGNYAYMAPEQWQGQTSPATDQYSLAIVVYQLLTGELPFRGPTQELAHQQLSSMPDAPGTLNTHVSAAIDAVILRALAKNAEERFSNIQEFALALQQACDYRDMRTALSISHIEAKLGGERMVTLPDRRQIMVEIPPNTQDGQVLRVPEQGTQYYAESARGPLYLTLSVFHQNLVSLPGNSGELYLPNLAAMGESVSPAVNQHTVAEYDPSLSSLFSLPDSSTRGTIESASPSVAVGTEEAVPVKTEEEQADALDEQEKALNPMSNEAAIANTPVVPVTAKPITGTIPIVPIAGHPVPPEISPTQDEQAAKGAMVGAPRTIDLRAARQQLLGEAPQKVDSQAGMQQVGSGSSQTVDLNGSSKRTGGLSMREDSADVWEREERRGDTGQVVAPFAVSHRDRKRPRFSPIYTVLIVIIALALVASAFVFLSVHNSQVDAANAHATALSQAQNRTATSQALTQAHAAATATQRADNATATAQAQARATATEKANLVSIAAANPDLYYSGTSNLAMVDPLNSAAASQWSNNTKNATGQCQFSALGYQVSQTQAGALYNCKNSTTYTNFVFEVQVTIDQGDCGGITVRGNGSNFYFFNICRNGTYNFTKYATNTAPAPLASSYSAAINTALGGTNTIAIVAINNTFYLYINSTTQYVNTVSDVDYTQGLFGLAALSSVDATTVVFQNARAWTVGS